MAKRIGNATIKVAENKKKDTVIQQIIIRPVERGVADISKWRSAHRSAEGYSKIRRELYDLYDDVLLDGHLDTVVDRRIKYITNGGIQFFDKDGQEVEDITNYIDKLAFHNLLTEIMWTIFWGVTVLEYNPKTQSWYSIPRKHIWPHQKKITWEQSGGDGIVYCEPPHCNYMVQIGKDDDLGKLLKVTPYVLYKRGNIGDWAQFAEIFGMPFREYRYDGYDDKTRRELEYTAENTGGAAYAILPKEAEFKIHPNNSTGSKDVYNGLHDMLNKEISKTILGNTETTESSSSSGYAQAKTHGETEDEIKSADRRWVERVLNEQILPIMALHGWPVEGGYFAFPEKEKELTVDEYKSISSIIPISKKFFYEKFNIPVPEEGEDIVTIPQPIISNPIQEDKDKKSKNLSADHQRFFG